MEQFDKSRSAIAFKLLYHPCTKYKLVMCQTTSFESISCLTPIQFNNNNNNNNNK